MYNDFRFYYSQQAREVYEENSYGDKKLFPQRSDMFFWCVAIGHKNSPKPPAPLAISDKKRGEIHWGAFDDEIQKPFLNMIAVDAFEGFDVLGKSKEYNDKFRDIIQAYAELGFTVLSTYMNGQYTSERLMEILIENVKLD